MNLVYREDVNLWWPAVDPRIEKSIPYLLRFVPDSKISLPYVKDRNLVLQAGGHVGTWPLSLGEEFKEVVTFEPEPQLYACLVKNISNHGHIHPHNKALGAKPGTAQLFNADKPGNGQIHDGRPGVETIPVEMITIDSLNLSPSLMVLDIEWMEIEALKGALDTIKRCRPVLHLEVQPDQKKPTFDLMKKLRYRHVLHRHKDDIFVPVK